MKRTPSPLILPVFFLTLSTAFLGVLPSNAADPEKESIRISENLRPYTDEQWAEIAGAKSDEKYEIIKNDTLWDVSARLFGDAKVWPKVWEINNASILNPHMIEPRMTLVFTAGTGVSLPSINLRASGTSTVTNHYVLSKSDKPGPLWDERTPRPNEDWKKLPRQSWENVQANLPGDIDKDGFDMKNRIYLRTPATGIELPQMVSCAPIESIAKIEGSRLVSNYAFVGSEVTISATGGPLEIDAVYTIVDPSAMELEVDGRKALSYAIAGRVKILGVQSGTYVGEVVEAKNPIAREMLLIPEMKRIPRVAPVAATQKTIGKLIADRRTGAFMTGQNKWVYINRGTKDGVQPGMLFRIFQNQDPKTLKPLTNGDVLVQGDVQIIQNCGEFSLGMFVWSRGDVPERYEGMLLTDVSDEKIRYYFNSVGVPQPAAQAPETTEPMMEPPQAEAPLTPSDVPAPIEDQAMKSTEESDWLDQLDNGQDLKSEEERELQQLEKFDEAKAGATQNPPPSQGSATDSASLGADLPPPPAEELPPPPASELPPEG